MKERINQCGMTGSGFSSKAKTLEIWEERNLKMPVSRRCWQLGTALAFGIAGAIAPTNIVSLTAFSGNRVLAQIKPDTTLGAEHSILTPNTNVRGFPAELIEGGATRGANLFHSFQDFNVGNAQRVYFANPAGIENILSRVTGNNLSNILGTLGVDGGANLFLLNPNGIIFGQNAKLDIAGSFVASTAKSLVFGNGSTFSATNPQAPPLLSVNLTPGLQYGANQPKGTITNSGNLAVGQDLTLSADNLDLQGQLQAGRDLTLQAQDAVRVRDTIANRLIASSGGKLLVEGNQLVDIFALNHPNSGFFSGGDMVLRSANTVAGDAHYWSGGSFRIEKLDGSLGNLNSPYDPIIRASGDVSFDSYEGASLHILAGGSVTIAGDVIITEPDTVANSIQENVTLSDEKTVVAINGSTQPTLDIRAGTTAFGTSSTTGNTAGFSPGSPNSTTTATSANIAIGGNITNPGGVVFLTNQYRPNTLAGNISAQNIDTSKDSPTSNETSIAIDSRGSISTGNLLSFSRVSVVQNGNPGNGGRIDLIAGGNIITGELSSYSFSSAFTSNAGDGGAIALAAGGNIATGELFSYSSSDSYYDSNAGKGGAIALFAGGDITTGQMSSNSYSLSGGGDAITGKGGAIVLFAGGDITTGKLSANSSATANYDALTGDGGEIDFNAGGNIIIGEVSSDSFTNSTSDSNAGNGGTIALSAGGDITTGLLSSDSYSISRAAPSNSGNGGAIALVAGGNITTEELSSDSDSYSSFSSANAGNGGAIALTADSNITIGQLSTTSAAESLYLNNSRTGNGGAVTLTADGNITTDNLTTSSENGRGDISLTAQNNISSTGFIDASGSGTGGNIILTSQSGEVLLENTLITSNVSGTGTGGTIRIEADSVALTNTDLATTLSGEGDAGKVLIDGRQSVSLKNGRISTSLEAGATGSGGNVRIQSSAGSISLENFTLDTATFGQGDAGDVIIKANDSVFLTGSSIFSITNGPKNAGNVTVEAGGALSLTQSSTISTAVDVQGIEDSGDINIKARSLSLTEGSQLQALTRSTGDSGNININVSESMIVSGIGSDGFLSAVLTSSNELNSGRGGNIEINTPGNVLVTDGAVLSAQTASTSDGGNISVNANTLTLKNGGQLLTNTFSSGKAGNITVNATESVTIAGIDPNFDSRVSPRPLLRDEVPVVNPPVTLAAIDTNNSINTAQEIDGFFALDSLDNRNSNVDFSTRIPYVSVGRGNTPSKPDSYDYYSFEVTTAGTRVIIDIDDTRGSSGFDSTLTLFDSQGTELASNDNSPSLLGAGGSCPTRLIGTNSNFSFVQTDSYIGYVFSEPGRYFIRVGDSEGGNSVPIVNNAVNNVSYTLQVSLDTPKVASSIANSGTSLAASGLFARTEGAGAAGSITIHTPQVSAQDGAQVSASTSSSGQGGSLIVRAPQGITLTGNSQLSVETSGAGQAGNVSIATETLNIESGAKVSATATATATTSEQGGSISVNANQLNLSGTGGLLAETQGVAPAGSLTLQPFSSGQNLTVNLQDGAKISASTSSEGQGGSLNVTAPQVVTLSGNGQLSVETSGTGQAGNVAINTQQLTVQDRAQVSASTSGIGKGGSLEVKASDSVLLNNQGSLVTESSGTGAAGNLTINTRQLTLREGSQVSASTVSSQGGDITLQNLDTLQVSNSLISASTQTGTAGNLTVNATESVQLSGVGGLSVEATDGGTAGDLAVETGEMSIQDGAKVTVSSPSGQAGNLTITANSLSLNRGTISAETGKSGAEDGANITLQGLDLLRLDNESLISASALEDANGGNITIDSTFIVATPPTGSQGSDITANAFRGNGGRVNITTQGLFGIEFRPQRTPLNDITVSSEFGLVGIFEQNTPGVDPSRGLAELPTNVVDASRQIDRRCSVDAARQERGSFTVTGRGGLPPSPNDVLRGESVITNWVNLDSDRANNTSSDNLSPPSSDSSKIVEAQGWVVNEKGHVVLTASASTVTPHDEWLQNVKCNPPQTPDKPQP